MGDFVRVEGPVWRTRTGELTVDAQQAELLAKSLRPLPEKWHGLTDVEARFRHRHLDLLVNEESRRSGAAAQPGRLGAARRPRSPRLPRGGDAHAPAAVRRRRRAAVHDPSPRLRPGSLPAHLGRAVSQAAGRRRARSRLRDRPQLPQRGHLAQAQSRVHDDGVLPGVRRLSRHDGSGRGADPGGRAGGARHAPDRVPGQGARSRGPLAAAVAGRGDRSARPESTCSPTRISPSLQQALRRRGLPVRRRAELGEAGGRRLQRARRAGAARPDLHHGPPDRAVAAGQALDARIRGSPSASSPTSRAWRSATPSASSTIPTSSGAGSKSRCARSGTATARRIRSTRTTSPRSSTGCRRRAGSGSASTGW